MEGICCVYSELQEKMQEEESILPEVCIQVNSSTVVIQPDALYLEKMVTNDLLYECSFMNFLPV